ncbi:MAG: twin-arginine translocase TatA/TatE family subunit [Alphaproteobacteria bacterium]|nr:twin-arginine translocase TatA/TatE family subunit [Alphaproteobacteria bacterium]
MRFGFWEIIVILVLVFVLFGSAKFPSMMKNLAEGINVFKKEMGNKKEAGKGKKEEASEPKPVVKKAAKKPAAKKK